MLRYIIDVDRELNVKGESFGTNEIFQLMVPGIEIIIIAVMMYYLLSFFWNTRAMDLLVGFWLFFLVFDIVLACVLSSCYSNTYVVFCQCGRHRAS